MYSLVSELLPPQVCKETGTYWYCSRTLVLQSDTGIVVRHCWSWLAKIKFCCCFGRDRQSSYTVLRQIFVPSSYLYLDFIKIVLPVFPILFYSFLLEIRLLIAASVTHWLQEKLSSATCMSEHFMTFLTAFSYCFIVVKILLVFILQ